MRSRAEVELVKALFADGLNHSEIARRTGISRSTIRQWLAGGEPDFDQTRSKRRNQLCPLCRGQPEALPRPAYPYLLGMYLGDGCISDMGRGVGRLRISCTTAYPDIMEECERAMGATLPNRVGRVRAIGCTEVAAYSKHWVCLFPQHGPGPKHLRAIELTDWQWRIVDPDPRPLLRGLIHSDGCRVDNRVNGKAYPRYHFTSASDDIRAIFGRACDAVGVEWRHNKPREISVARRKSVAILDEFIGPKR